MTITRTITSGDLARVLNRLADRIETHRLPVPLSINPYGWFRAGDPPASAVTVHVAHDDWRRWMVSLGVDDVIEAPPDLRERLIPWVDACTYRRGHAMLNGVPVVVLALFTANEMAASR